MQGRRWAAAGVALAASLLVAPSPGDARGIARPAVLASYSFDDDVATGPDTFAIWQGARHSKGGRGHVRLSSAFHMSGHRSVELEDVAGDSDFPELQGYFPVRRAGQLFFHFAFLTTDPGQELNIALAGPRSFQLEKDGIAFWLGTRDGRLVHYSDSIPKRLFVPEAFVWYAVDVTYHIAAGRYDLVIRAEGRDEPLVSLRAQPNAASQPASTVDKFSFVGAPFSDGSNVVYYVDDVVIGTDESVTKLPFTAPGRRKLFVDSFGEYQRLLRERPHCLPASAPEDFGLGPGDLQALVAAGFAESLQRLIAAPGEPSSRLPSERGPERWQRVLEAAFAWNEGCLALERGNASVAYARFAAAADEVPEGPLFSLSAALALAVAREDRGSRRSAGARVRVAARGPLRSGVGLRRARAPGPRACARVAAGSRGTSARPRRAPRWRRAAGDARHRAVLLRPALEGGLRGRARLLRCGWRSAPHARACPRRPGPLAPRTPASTGAIPRRPASCTRRHSRSKRIGRRCARST